MIRRNRPLLLALAVSLTLLATTLPHAQAADQVKFTVHAGETVTQSIGDYEVQVEATDDVVVYLSLDGDSLMSGLEPGRAAEGDPYVTLTLLGPPDQVIFNGVVRDQIMTLFFTNETGHTEG